MLLQQLRDEIDTLDTQLLDIFEKRMKISSEILQYKLENNLPIEDTKRETQLIKKISAAASEELVKYDKKLFSEIISLSKEYQKQKTIKE
ncbi:MAG: chorismate mutase [Oscillospiraceae bacterium]